MNHTFCADLSQQQNDPLAGSAAHVEQNLLISWPRAQWERKLRHARDMSDTLKQLLNATAERGLRINLIQQPGMEKYQHQIFLMPQRQRFSVPRDRLEHFLNALHAGTSLAQWEQSALAHDLVLCCTHGKKDKCCAKYGYRTYKALAHTAAEHQLPFEIWESSHLGGCRLAASILVLPDARKYGRIAPEQTLPFLQAEARGQRFLPGYRGDSQLPPAQQCSQLAVLQRISTEDSQPRLTLLEDTGNEQKRVMQWRREDTQRRMTVTCRALTIMRVDTCADLEQGPTESVVWRVVEIE